MHGRSYQVGKIMEPFHLQIDAQSEEELSEKKIVQLLQRSANK